MEAGLPSWGGLVRALLEASTPTTAWSDSASPSRISSAISGCTRAMFVDRAIRVNSGLAGESDPGGEVREANWFAAELLMPEAMIREIANQIASHRQLSDDGLVRTLADTSQVSRPASISGSSTACSPGAAARRARPSAAPTPGSAGSACRF